MTERDWFPRSDVIIMDLDISEWFKKKNWKKKVVIWRTLGWVDLYFRICI